MSLADLWNAHSDRRSIQLAVSTDASALDTRSSSTFAASASRQAKRKRLAESTHTGEVPKVQSETARKPARSFALGETDLGSGSIIIVKPKAFRHDDSQKLYKSLKEEISWLHKEITVYGKKIMQPRQVAYMASDTSLSYTYSHTKLQPEAWHPQVAQVKSELEAIAGVEFNSCLLNLYRDGNDHMGWHSDNEKLYGDDPTIGSVSFGATRRFLLRSNQDHTDKWSYDLCSGDVLIMKGSTQQHWTHSIPKMTRVAQPRINLTFRQIVRPET